MEDFAQVAWNLLINPNISYLLMVVGVWAVVLGISAPGTGVPETAAILCLGLAAVGLLQGPVNWFGLLLVALAIVLFMLEFQVASHGALLLAGSVALGAGALVLFGAADRPGPTLSWVTVLGAPALAALPFAYLVRQGLAVQRQPALHARHLTGLVGASGVTRTQVEREGTVYVAGEEWSATADRPILPGTDIVVVDRRGLVLKVAPARQTAPAGPPPAPHPGA